MTRSPSRLLLGAAALALASVASAQIQPTELPPTPAPTTPPTTPIPTVTAPVLALLPALEAGDKVTVAVALPASGGWVLESSTNMATWTNESSTVPSSRVAVKALEKVPGELRRFYRVRQNVL